MLTPVTNPVDELIVAILGLAELHVPPGVVELNVVVNPTQATFVPLNVPVLNPELIVTVLVVLTSVQPPVPATV